MDSRWPKVTGVFPLSCDELLTVKKDFFVVEHLSFLKLQIQLLKVNILAFLKTTLPTVVLRLEYGNTLYLFFQMDVSN